MNISQDQLADIGKRAADAVGIAGVRDVEAMTILDSSDELALMFSFLLQQQPDRDRLGLLRTNLSLKLRDELLEWKDDRYPFIRLFTESDWEKRERAQFG